MQRISKATFIFLLVLPFFVMIYGHSHDISSKATLSLVVVNWCVLAINEHLGAYPFTIKEKKKFMIVFGSFLLLTTALVNGMSSGNGVGKLNWKIALASCIVFALYSSIKPSFRKKLHEYWSISLWRKE